ncbi:MAG: hypothetical protein RPR98_02320, partial [Bermanella sp.]
LEFSMKLILILLSMTFVSSCAFVPSSSGKQGLYNECDMSTKKLSLKKIGDSDFCFKGAKLNELVGCLVVGGFVGSTSAVVSGSIVLIGNTIHWMEYQATC